MTKIFRFSGFCRSGTELVILPELRHAILLEAPQAVAPPVLDFLRRQAGV
jgi:alpha-beta hydrolase superfamily lysophospholipase